MDITDMGTEKTKRNYSIVFVVLALYSLPSFANDWRVTPRVSFEETFTDNVELNSINEIDSFVSMLSPGLNLEYLEAGASLELDYELTQAWYTHDHDLDDNFHNLSATGRIDLLPNGLSLNASATIRNVSENDTRNALADIVSGDTVEYNNYRLGLAYNVQSSSFTIGSAITLLLDEAEDKVGERDGYIASFASASGSNSRVVFWNINSQYSDYDNSNRDGRFYTAELKTGYISDFKLNPFIRYYDEGFSGNINDGSIQGSSSIGAGIRWLASPHLIIDMAYNSADDDTSSVGDDAEEQDDYVSALIEWQPSSRTSLLAKYYQRFFGDAYQFSYRHRSKRLTTAINYNESIQAFDRLEFVPVNSQSLWCLTAAPTDISSCLFSPGEGVDLSDYTLIGSSSDYAPQQADHFSLNKTLNVTSSLNLQRTSYKLTLRKSERKNLEIGDYDIYENAKFSINRQTSRTTDLKFSYSFNKNHINKNNPDSLDQIDHYRIYKLSWEQRLSRSLTATFSGQHLNRSSNRFYYDYTENRLAVKLAKEF